ncbi:ATP-binding protein, partial [Mycobacterium sp. THU-M116]
VDSPDLDWQSVWDRGWSLAAEAEDKPVEAHTAEHGLPVRTPGARLVPGAADGAAPKDTPKDIRERSHESHESHDAWPGNGGDRDPEAVRASLRSHFGGVRTGRTHARETSNGTDQS